jgi:hypothetical protein
MQESLACRISDAADRCISHPAAFVSFNFAIAAGLLWGDANAVNVTISILTTDILLITAISARRARLKLEREAAELVRVHPEIDETSLEAE